MPLPCIDGFERSNNSNGLKKHSAKTTAKTSTAKKGKKHGEQTSFSIFFSNLIIESISCTLQHGSTLFYSKLNCQSRPMVGFSLCSHPALMDEVLLIMVNVPRIAKKAACSAPQFFSCHLQLVPMIQRAMIYRIKHNGGRDFVVQVIFNNGEGVSIFIIGLVIIIVWGPVNHGTAT